MDDMPTITTDLLEKLYDELFNGGVDNEGFVTDGTGEKLTNNNGDYIRNTDVTNIVSLTETPFAIRKDGKIIDIREDSFQYINQLYVYSGDDTFGVLTDDDQVATELVELVESYNS